MAEGLLRAAAGDRYRVDSAGTEATTVRPEAVEAMHELGIDIAAQHSKSVERFIDEPVDWLITVCDEAREACPTLPGAARQLHWSVEDPSRVEGDHERRMAAFRAARDDLSDRIQEFLDR
jgi:arsenate reductase